MHGMPNILSNEKAIFMASEQNKQNWKCYTSSYLHHLKFKMSV